jgi:hypothetical protein
MRITDLVGLAGQLQDPLGRGGFARVNVRENADVSVVRKITHDSILASGGLVEKLPCAGKLPDTALPKAIWGPIRPA